MAEAHGCCAAAGSKALERRYKFKKRQQREDAIAAALQEAAVAADADQARLQQSQMLEALFELFFRVLKRCTASGLLQAGAGAGPTEATVREKFPLLYVALEGLGKYTHLVGLEYFTDLLDVFQQLLGRGALPLGLRMRCLLSTVDILSAQGDALNIDRRQIYMHLYGAIAEAPMEHIVEDAEEADEGLADVARGVLNGEGPGDGDGEDSCAVLVAKAASQLLGWLKVGDSARLGAFVKRLCSSALHAEPGLAVALVSIASRCVRSDVLPPDFKQVSVPRSCTLGRCQVCIGAAPVATIVTHERTTRLERCRGGCVFSITAWPYVYAVG